MNTPMEKIKAYQQVESFLTLEDAEELATKLGLTEDDLKRRIQGKDSEFDFLLRCHALGQIEHIIAFEEGLSRLTNTVTLDYLFILKNGRRLAIEVKTTEKDFWGISKSVFNKKKKFAEMMQADLYFAVKIGNWWRLHSANFLESNNRKVTKDSYKQSEMYILGEKEFFIHSQLTFKSYYRRESNKQILIPNADNPNKKWGLHFIDFGYLERYIIEYNEKPILTINRQQAEKFMFIVLALHGLQVDAANFQHEEIKQKNGRLITIDKTEANIGFTLSDLLIAPVSSVIDQFSKPGNPKSFIASLVDRMNREITDPMAIIYSLSYLVDKKVPISVIKYNNQEIVLNDFKKEYTEIFTENK